MEKSFKRDTLAYQLGVRPYTQRVNHRGVPNHRMAHRLKAALAVDKYDPCGSVSVNRVSSPEADALDFYLMNHAVALVANKVHPLEPLGKYLPLLEAYHDVLAEQTRRMFLYLYAICTRESRHNKGESSSSFWTSAKEKYGAAVWDFHYLIRNKGSDGAVEALCEHPPVMSLGNYTSYLSHAFYHGHYSSGFGGKAWGDIAEVLRKFVHGEFSAEMMLDTAFTLCHNNGPIFNKGLFFTMYGKEIYKILDVQRSGQIPHYIYEVGATGKVSSRFDSIVKIMGLDGLLGDQHYVDWYLVEDMGSLKKYPAEKEAQKSKGQKFGHQPVVENYGGYPKPKKLNPYTSYGEVDKPVVKGLEIMPGLIIEQVEIERE